jgi:hypothetical protein
MPELTLEGGAKIRTFAPPRGFDPLTASLADLQRYGFPPRPEDPRHLARYTQFFSRLKNKFRCRRNLCWNFDWAISDRARILD